MLHYNELKYNRDNNILIVDVAIDDLSYFDNVIMDTIIIDSQDSYVPNGPSSKPIYSYKIPASVQSLNKPTKILINEADGTQGFIDNSLRAKRVRLEIPVVTLGINPFKEMIFVYSIASGIPAPSTPCGMDNSKLMRTVVNLQNIYKSALCYLKEVESDCNIPKNFIDFILRFKALELCIRTGNYTQAIKYWKKFFANIKVNVIPSKCRCNG